MGGQSTYVSHLPSVTSHTLIIPNDCLLPLSLMIHTNWIHQMHYTVIHLGD